MCSSVQQRQHWHSQPPPPTLYHCHHQHPMKRAQVFSFFHVLLIYLMDLFYLSSINVLKGQQGFG